MLSENFKNVSIEELYNWAKEHNVEKLRIGLQYQDGGGFYYGDTISEGDGSLNVSFVQLKDNNSYLLLE